jgi:cytochrome c oxidase cbb3-type subunit III
VYAQACALCHGDDGAGTGDGESPGRINDPALLSLFSDQVLRRIIITGRPDLGMPDFAGSDGRDSDFKPLTGEQIDDLVALLAHWRASPPKIAAHLIRD